MSDFDVMPDFLAGLERDLRRRAAALDAEVMPDFLPALERQLRRRAAATAPSRRSAARWRRPAFAIAFAASVLAQALMVDAPVVREAPAFGSPPILGVSTVRVPSKLRARFPGGEAATDAWAFPAFGDTAYVTSNAVAWCLWMPDPRLPGHQVGAVCQRTAEFFQEGLVLKVGRRYLAVLPTSRDHPTLRHADGTTETLDPTPEGVVAVEHMEPGDRIFVRRADGTTRVDRNYALDATQADTNTTNNNTDTTDDEEG